MPAFLDDQLIPLRDAFKPVLGADPKYEKCLYYRHPDVWNAGSRMESRNRQAGWIMWAGNNSDRMRDLMIRGFTPLLKFGICQRNEQWSREAQGTPDQYGPWGAILMHPEGPAAFPISQIMTFRWYDQRHCPVPGVVFPQLDGATITEFTCPDCTDRVFGQALHLSRHLRNQHEWTVDDVIKFGEAMGLDFRREFTKDVRISKVYSAANDERPVPRGTVPSGIVLPTVERIVPVRSGDPERDSQPVAKNPHANKWTPERRAEASRKAKEKLAAQRSTAA